MLTWSLRLAWLGMLFVAFGLTAYLSFSLFVRSGVTTVPDLTGLTEEEAAGQLGDQGLEYVRLEQADDFESEIEAGRVRLQDPSPRALVKRGSPVAVGLSLGPQVVEVPDLRNRSLQAAQVTLAARGLALGRTLGVLSQGAEAGLVVDQNPPARGRVSPGAPVDLLVSQANRGETYLMPDLVYRDYEVVERFFRQRGFRLGSVKFEVYEGVRDGTILRQFPLAGHPLKRNEAVALVVARGADVRSGGALP